MISQKVFKVVDYAEFLCYKKHKLNLGKWVDIYKKIAYNEYAKLSLIFLP